MNPKCKLPVLGESSVFEQEIYEHPPILEDTEFTAYGKGTIRPHFSINSLRVLSRNGIHPGAVPRQVLLLGREKIYNTSSDKFGGLYSEEIHYVGFPDRRDIEVGTRSHNHHMDSRQFYHIYLVGMFPESMTTSIAAMRHRR